ncbi:MAG: hypothetical protein II595_08590 [Desulfovibrio sp.]|nr:hypothetical protein [Desulfovibrio sp.]
MTLVNLTPHAVRLFHACDADERLTLRPSARCILSIPPRLGDDGRPSPARVSVEWRYAGVEEFGAVEGLSPLPQAIRVYSPVYGELYGLPAPDGETVYIVSKMVADAAAASGRALSDLRLVSQTVRDSEGRIVGCLGLSRP